MLLRFKVEGMSCTHCAEAIKRAIVSLPGVRRVTVQLHPDGEAIVEGECSAESIISAIETEGYRATLKG
ncbi:MAG: heavy-metal-associated domain-containing protein [Deltaproteobacteria bacterium]|nr:heavy-metal-associated domain-containing protein [Sandaracinaceae bacterium]MCX7807355.1 heavy-metal-associated domain-containing protein [Deltaproteobacteria bacterium]MDW8247644.1 heavy metal-associated domain-containing protein [Sandaracinaceae bacterium]